MDIATIITFISGVLGAVGVGAAKNRITSAKKIADITATTLRRIALEYIEERVDELRDELGARYLPNTEDIEAVVWRRLITRGIKKTVARDLVVHELALIAVGRLRRELNKAAAKVLRYQVADAATKAEGVLDAFNPKEPAREALGEVELVK